MLASENDHRRPQRRTADDEIAAQARLPPHPPVDQAARHAPRDQPSAHPFARMDDEPDQPAHRERTSGTQAQAAGALPEGLTPGRICTW